MIFPRGKRRVKKREGERRTRNHDVSKLPCCAPNHFSMLAKENFLDTAKHAEEGKRLGNEVSAVAIS